MTKIFINFDLTGSLASAPVIASVLFDYIVIYGNGRFKAGLLLGIVLLLLFLLLSFISIAIWAAINSNTTGQRRMMLIISAYLMIWLAFGNLYYFFSDTENFVATNTTSVEGLVKEWDGDMHVTELQESTVLRNVPHFGSWCRIRTVAATNNCCRVLLIV